MKIKRKKWFKVYTGFIKIFKKKTKFVYLDKEIESPALIISNHVGSKGPLSFVLFSNIDARFWGTYKMNSGLKKTYEYLTKTYYHQKHGWNIHLARVFCLLAAPLANMFYKGINLISTYQDSRLVKTYNESLETIKNNQNVIIFPEMSDNGYFDELTSFCNGFLSFSNFAYKKGFDLPIYVAYYHKKSNVHMIDKKVLFSELIKDNEPYDDIAKKLCDRCNELGRICEENYINSKKSTKKAKKEN